MAPSIRFWLSANGNFLVGFVVGVLATIVVIQYLPRSSDPSLDHFTNVRDFVRETYVHEVTDEELVEHALHGMLSGLDNYSRFYDRHESEALNRETVGRYVGIGVVFRRPVEEGQVLFALPSSPADRAGVRVGDRFVRINGSKVAGLPGNGLRDLLKASQDGLLEVDVVGRDGEERQLRIAPDEIIDPTVRHTTMLDEENKIGYIAVLSFSRETDEEFDRAVDFLMDRGMKGLVLDLRHNYGGVLESAARIAERFIPEGVIVSTEGRGAPEIYHATASSATNKGLPLVVLVDEDSASASEVLAGALQDHRVAVIAGSPTYGKGMVQNIKPFKPFGTIAKVTSSYYYTPTHRNFERSAETGKDYGIQPDVRVPINELERSVIHGFLGRYGPPLEAISALETWEAEEDTFLLERHPPDPQLDAALALFEGTRPGAYRASE